MRTSDDGTGDRIAPVVLVLDDESTLHRLLLRELDGRGVVVESHTDARTALDALTSDEGPRPAVLVLDIRMPVLDGHEVLAALRASPTTADLPVIVLSGSDRGDDRRRAWDLGITAYVRKPDDLAGFRELAALVAGFARHNLPPLLEEEVRA